MARSRTPNPRLVVFEDAGAARLAPLSLLRPVFDIKVGVVSLRAKIARHLGLEVGGTIVREYLREEFGVLPSVQAGETVLLVNGRVVCNVDFAIATLDLPLNTALVRNGTLLAARIDAKTFGTVRDDDVGRLLGENLPTTEIEVPLLCDPWDVVRYFDEELVRDMASAPDSRLVQRRLGSAFKMPETPRASPQRIPRAPAGAHFLKPRNILIMFGTRIFPDVVINAEAGPVWIRNGCSIRPFSYIEGPCFIDDNVVVKPHTSLAHASIGRGSRIAGEIHNTTMHAFVNKQHEGFVGHSYFAPWVNLGAGTITSNLKNTYGHVRAIRNGAPIDTGMQFLGTIAGDHAKFGINTMLNTGTIIGVGSNVFGAGFPAKEIPSFRWGSELAPVDFRKFVDLAQTVMARRQQELSPSQIGILRAAYALANAPRS